MVRTLDQGDRDVDHGVAGDHAPLGRLDDSLLDGRDILPRNRAADDLVDELEPFPLLTRLDGDPDVAVLAATAGLADVAPFLLHLARDRLAVGDLGAPDVRLDLELAQQAVDDDLEVEFAHPRNEGLPRLLVVPDLEGGVLHHQFLEGEAELLLVRLGLRLDGDGDDRRGRRDRLEDDLVVLVAEGVARVGGLQPDHRGDLAGVDGLDLFPLVGVHLQEPADPLLLLADGIVDEVSRAEHAGIDTHEGEVPHEGVVHDLEGERREGLVVGRLADRLGLAVRVDSDDRRDIDRGREVIDHRVEHRLDALVAERRAADDRGDPVPDGGLADRAHELLDRDLLSEQVPFHERVVDVGHRLEQALPRGGDFGRHVVGDRLVVELRSEGVLLPDDRLHPDQVDDPAEGVFLPQGKLDGDGIGGEPFLHHPHHALEIGAGAVHFIDHGEAGHAEFVRLAPHRLGLGLHAADRAEDRHRAVEHPQGTLHLDREVDVPRRVDDVDAVPPPEARRRGGGDGDAPLLLLLHPVHRGGAVVDLAHLMGDAGVIEHTLGRRRLPGVDVGHDPDVPGFVER